MSILVFVRYYPARSETFVRRQAERLSAAVMCERFYPESYASMGLTGKVYEIGGKSSVFDSYCKARGALGLLSDIWSPSQRKAAKRILREVRPRAVLAHYGPNAIKIASLCKRQGIRLFVHFHGYDASSLLRNSSYLSNITKVLKFSAGAVVVSDAMATTIRGLVEGEKVHVIPCGVDLDIFANGTTVGKEPGTCRFLMVGRLVEKKAPLISIRAFEACADVVPDCELRIIGFGPLRQAIDEHIAGSRHREKIHMLGSKDFSEVRREMLAADVFVQHSVTASDGNTEGWPISIAEAAAAGLPIVSTRHAGIPMQVRHEETGFLVEEGDAGEMAKCMEELAKDPHLRLRMGEESRKHIANVGSIDDSVSRLYKFIDERVHPED